MHNLGLLLGEKSFTILEFVSREALWGLNLADMGAVTEEATEIKEMGLPTWSVNHTCPAGSEPPGRGNIEGREQSDRNEEDGKQSSAGSASLVSHPADLISDHHHYAFVVETGLRWSVAHTKPRQEKALAEQLDQYGIGYFLPLLEQVRVYGHRKREVSLPLFPGYVFLWAGVEDKYRALDTGRIASLIQVHDQATLEKELSYIRLGLEQKTALDPHPYLTTGRRVCVTAGPLKGMEGVIEERKKANRLILIVQTIGRAVSLEVDEGILMPLD